jgi:drug/metabolite transporter (DMT)-like permease
MDWVAAVGRHPRSAALMGALCIAFSGIFFRFSGVSPATATVFRCLYALPFLGLIALGERRRLGPFAGRGHASAIGAGVFFAADLLFWHHAVNEVGAGLATVVANLQVVIVAVVAWVVLRERPSRGISMAIPVMLGGAVLISGVVGPGAYGADPRLGVAFGLASAFAYSGYLLLTRQGNPGGIRPATMLFDASLATAVTAAIVGAAVGELNPIPSWPAHGWLLAVALTSQVAGYLLISASLPRLPAALTSVILFVQPVATVFLGAVLLAEAPSAFQLAGVGLVIVGLLVANVPGRARLLVRGNRGAEPESAGAA